MAVLWLLLVFAAAASASDNCDLVCQDIYDPVCGDNGLTYPNQCSLDAYNCETDSNIQVEHMGECEPKAGSKKECNAGCPYNLLPLCGDDGITYPNQCALDFYNCISDSSVQVAYPGECKECNLICAAIYDPVCGTDGETYPSECSLDVHNCQTDSNVQVDHKGECDQKAESKKECDMMCPLNYQPVCGDDGNTYPNQCTLDGYNCETDSNVQVAYPGECSECNLICFFNYDPVCGTDGETYPNQCAMEVHNCQTNSNVQVDHKGECQQKSASKNECERPCPLNYMPVCGSDGITYPNECTLDVHNCATDSNVQVAYPGECKDCNLVCPDNYSPVCGTNGVTYPNQCAMDVHNCLTDSNVQVDHEGECGQKSVSTDCDMSCPLHYQPVCGDDGFTYPNQCALDVYNCVTDSNVQVDHEGECGQKSVSTDCDMSCPLHYQPVCGDDGFTYPNLCALDVHNCVTDSNVQVAYPGSCKKCNMFCPAVYSPVCGTDGETYPNQCAMDVHNCQTNSNVEVDHNGECKKKTALKGECDLVCPGNYEPVCGTDSVTYGNPCALDVHNCVTGSSVIVAYEGECDEHCVVPCPNCYDPVCGTDGVTYSNPCQMGTHNCFADPDVEMDHMGPCEEKAASKGECDMVCPEHYEPVCGTDGITYGNKCMLDVQNCLSGSSVLVAYEGECAENCVVPCPNCYDPVCGTDGVTYSNPCQMGTHNCFADPDVEMDHMGPCEEKAASKGECDMVCPANYEPVCGTDGLTYGNKCMLDVQNCLSGSNVLVAYEGECDEECNIVCPNCYDPVCGTDGVTYSNPCELGVHNCQTNSDVQVDHPGKCEQ